MANSNARVIVLTVSFAGAAACNHEDGKASQSCVFDNVESLGSAVNSNAFDGSPTVSSDEMELFFTSERNGHTDLFVASRTRTDIPWNEPINLGAPVDDTTAGDFSLRLSSDGNTLYFASNRSGGFGSADMYIASRAARHEAWTRPVNLGSRLNSPAFEAFPTPNADGTILYFNRSTSFDSEDSDLWMSRRPGPNSAWSEPQRLPDGINTSSAEFSPSISVDDNTLYFASSRSGRIEVWVSTRSANGQDWGVPRRLSEAVNSPLSMTLGPFISRGQRSLYFMSARPDSTEAETCTPATCFNRVDLYVARASCDR